MIRLWYHVHKRLSTLKKKASVLAPTTSINSSYERTAQSYTKIDKMVGYISVDFRIARTNLEPLRTANYMVQY